MDNILSQLEGWFAQRQLWIQDATRRIIQKNTLNSTDFDELTALCKQEAGVSNVHSLQDTPQGIPTGALSIKENSVTFRLEQIKNVKGINALYPRKPLQLGEGPITIVFGGTGSGKSSYVRLLKHACGAKKLGALYGNVFNQNSHNQECTFKVNIGDDAQELHWTPSDGILQDISSMQIYDYDCAYVYLTEQ